MPCPEHEASSGLRLAGGTGAAATRTVPGREPARLDSEWLLAEERARIGRDLHDLVIRRLFAVSLKLSGALSMIEQKEAGRRVDEAIADLDQTVKLIRSVVFALEHGSLPRFAPRPRRRRRRRT